MDNKKINEILTRGVNEVIGDDHLRKALLEGKKLRVKLGIDPTSPNIHIGRAVPLLKLRDFQEIGCQIVLIVGDFTGLIGDTSDKQSERPMLTGEIVRENMKSYVEQAAKILDISKVEVRYNSEWLKKLGFSEIGFQADKFSLADFISRENIKKRLDGGKRVSLREVLYPLMQGYDSVAIKADVEIGGTDQRFNLLAGRTLQPAYGQVPQDILMTNLILGTDGRKMSSSWGNTINLTDEANNMFGKVMSIPDDLIIDSFIHCTRVPMTKITQYQNQLSANQLNPRDLKIELALGITELYHSKKDAEAAKDEFLKVFSKKELPTDIPKVAIEHGNYELILLLVNLQAVSSNSEARRLIEQGGVKLDGLKITDPKLVVAICKGSLIQVGRRKFYLIK